MIWLFGLPFRHPKAAAVAMLFLASVAIGSGFADAFGTGTGFRAHPQTTQLAKKDIPPRYLAAYQRTGARYGVPWRVLAGIGKVESDHGRSTLPGVHSGANPWGACGPMQIGCVPGSKAGNSWARYGRGSVYDAEDAINGAARYLIAHGSKQDLRGAVWGYNHANWYVNKVLAWAERYRTGRFS